MTEHSNDTPRATEKKSDKIVKLRPTLFIAIGGTGMEVLMRLRRRLLNAVWGGGVRIESLAEFPVAQFMQFDLDQGAVIESGRAQTEDLQFDLLKFQEEERLVESFDLEKYSRDNDSLNRFPHIQNWLPIPPDKIRALKIDPAKGAGQIRAVSRLYFFDKYSKIRDKIRLKLKALKAGLSRDEQLKRLGLEMDASKIRVVVVGSVAGGTGSGSFLDMGFLAGWLAKKEVGSPDVELMIFLPTGFSGANKARTEANSYAALMELEAVMRGDADYVARWDDLENPELSARPYTDVYLLDSGNLAQQHTENMNDVYHMVADVLFEDFASADFANRKRSIAVNQQQHKIMPFSPPLPVGRFGDMKLSFAKSFSAFGQAALDTQHQYRSEERAYATAGEMLKAFFGVAAGGEGSNRPTEKARDEFMATHMHLRSDPFTQIPEFSAKSVQLKHAGGEFLDYAIVEELLRDRNGSIVAGVEQRVSHQLDQVMTGFKREEWSKQVRERVLDLENDVVRDQDSAADTTEDRIVRRRKELHLSVTTVLRQQLFRYLDNKEFGGIEFVLALVEQIKDRLTNADTGVCAVLDKNATRYREIQEAVRTHEFERLMTNLEQTKSGWMGSILNNGDAQARAIMEDLGKEIGNSLTFHLRAKAAAEAVGLMRAISGWLGDKRGVDASGQAQWSGLVGELQAGRQAVMEMLARLDRDVKILRKDIATEHVTLIPVAVEEDVAPMPPPATLREWANEAFKDTGGSQALFKELAKPEARSPLLVKLVRMAERHRALAATTVDGGGDKPDLLMDALRKRAPEERKRLFRELLQRAMPWVDASMGGDFTPNADQFKCFIGVAGADRFKSEFFEELKEAVPGGSGMTAAQIGVFETGIPGRVVCYIELSGIPLTVLRGMEAWRASYRAESERLPTHTHIDSTRFTHPIAPRPGELNGLADDFCWYLKAVMLGVLKRERDRTTPAGQYKFSVGPGDPRHIGNERSVRLNGLPLSYKAKIIEHTQLELDKLESAHCAALAALADFYAKEVYTPQLLTTETGEQQPRVGFASAMAVEVRKHFQSLALRKGGSEDENERALTLLHDEDDERDRNKLRLWADPVPESDADAYEGEVRAPSDAGHPRLKFVMKRDPAARAALAGLVRGEQASSVPTAGVAPAMPSLGVPPPLAVEHSYHVAVAGQTYGPYSGTQVRNMLQAGQINAQVSQVWRNGFAAWVPLAQCGELLPPTPPSTMPPAPPLPPLV